MWPNLQFPVDLVTFTEEIVNGKPHFLCNGMSWYWCTLGWFEVARLNHMWKLPRVLKIFRCSDLNILSNWLYVINIIISSPWRFVLKNRNSESVIFSYSSEDCTQENTSDHFQNRISTKSITLKFYSVHVLYNIL